MEQLKNLEQLKKGDDFYILKDGDLYGYEYMCTHPHNDDYILALDNVTMNADKFYKRDIEDMISRGKIYFGGFDNLLSLQLELQFLERETKRVKLCIEREKNKKQNGASL